VAVEQQANFMARQAAALLAGSGTPGADHVEKAGLLFAEAQALLEALVRIGPTAERKSLLGSLHKRRARGQAGTERQRSLQAMIDAYGEAAKLGAGNAWYPLLNEVSGLVAATWAAPSGGLGAEARKTIAQRLARLQEIAGDQDTSQCDFWESAFRADLALVDSLWKCDLVERRLAIEKAYGDAIRRGREVREQRSVLDQIAFFIAMADGAAQVDQALKDSLKQLQESLRVLVGEPQAGSGETPAAAAAGAPPRKKRKGGAKRRRPARRRPSR
jgi:hypothetical protein